ncbi:PH domain-containing protein [Metabacillus sp. KIGAM252]|uniref:PH domain-containing protein n=1 Tax=Metabacillus flavus TaxID=2823519 RepID=A0ABS5L9Q2_9BACI|nr:PH domain-containing protein [Metabacillus flavus]MBS2967455.1 PH domain-containing protein [Metabacillus flavus]
MRERPQNQISLKAKTVWQITGLITSAIFILADIGIGLLIYFGIWPLWTAAIGIAVTAVYMIFTVWLVPMYRQQFWRYEVHEQEIDLQHGWLTVKRTIIPMVRVQHVDTKQGPLLRKYKLASVEISTAATKHEIPALDMEEADRLRDSISKLARVTDDDV